MGLIYIYIYIKWKCPKTLIPPNHPKSDNFKFETHDSGDP